MLEELSENDVKFLFNKKKCNNTNISKSNLNTLLLKKIQETCTQKHSLKVHKQLLELKRKTNQTAITIRDFNTALSEM